MRRIKSIDTAYWYISAYFLVNLIFLTRFPFMHSDESWLSGLSRSMQSGGLGTTETFFDLFPRHPHAIKILFHMVQIGFESILGYSLFTFRLISLIAGIAVLVLFYKSARLLLKTRMDAFLATAALSLCIQFIYASHFARQEIIILAGMTGVLYFIMSKSMEWGYWKDIAAALATGVFAGVHPNSLIIALAAGSLYLYYIVRKQGMRISNLLVYIFSTALTAGIFIGISFMFDGNFISNYLSYGSGLGVSDSLAAKSGGILSYYQKLFNGVSGTYYTPGIRAALILFAVSLAGGTFAFFRDKNLARLLMPIAAVNIGFILIGRFSQPGVVLIFPLCILLLFCLIGKIAGSKSWMAAVAVCLCLAVNSAIGIIPYSGNEYKEYLDEIKSTVPGDSVVLANLNAEYAFGPGGLYDYRNLAYLGDAGLDFAGYIESRNIEYIIYPAEMDFIYERRPVWNVVYGNLYPYYGQMQEFLDQRCRLIYEFNSPYAMRIVRFSYEREWPVRIYEVIADE